MPAITHSLTQTPKETLSWGFMVKIVPTDARQGVAARGWCRKFWFHQGTQEAMRFQRVARGS